MRLMLFIAKMQCSFVILQSGKAYLQQHGQKAVLHYLRNNVTIHQVCFFRVFSQAHFRGGRAPSTQSSTHTQQIRSSQRSTLRSDSVSHLEHLHQKREFLRGRCFSSSSQWGSMSQNSRVCQCCRKRKLSHWHTCLSGPGGGFQVMVYSFSKIPNGQQRTITKLVLRPRQVWFSLISFRILQSSWEESLNSRLSRLWRLSHLCQVQSLFRTSQHNPVAVKALKQFIVVIVFTKSVIQCDGHWGLLKPQEQVTREPSAPTQVSPLYNHQSHGTVESLRRLYKVKRDQSGIGRLHWEFTQTRMVHFLHWPDQRASYLTSRYLITEWSGQMARHHTRRCSTNLKKSPTVQFGERVLAHSQSQPPAKKLQTRASPQKSYACVVRQGCHRWPCALVSRRDGQVLKARTIARLGQRRASSTSQSSRSSKL